MQLSEPASDGMSERRGTQANGIATKKKEKADKYSKTSSFDVSLPLVSLYSNVCSGMLVGLVEEKAGQQGVSTEGGDKNTTEVRKTEALRRASKADRFSVQSAYMCGQTRERATTN